MALRTALRSRHTEGTNETGVDAAPVVAGDVTFDPSLRTLAERMLSAWNRGDLDAWLACMDPEVELSPMLDEAGHLILPGLVEVAAEGGAKGVHESILDAGGASWRRDLASVTSIEVPVQPREGAFPT